MNIFPITAFSLSRPHLLLLLLLLHRLRCALGAGDGGAGGHGRRRALRCRHGGGLAGGTRREGGHALGDGRNHCINISFLFGGEVEVEGARGDKGQRSEAKWMRYVSDGTKICRGGWVVGRMWTAGTLSAGHSKESVTTDCELWILFSRSSHREKRRGVRNPSQRWLER